MDERTQTNSRSAGHQRRTLRLNDPRWQLGMACAVTMMLLGAGALYLLGSKLMSSPKLEESLGSSVFEFVRVGADIFFFGAMAAVVHQVIVRLTHSVTGPAFVIERGLRAMEHGDLTERLKLRDGDYLTTVADAAQALQTQLVSQREAVERIVAELEVAAGDEQQTRRAIDALQNCLGLVTAADESATERVDGDTPTGESPEAQAA